MILPPLCPFHQPLYAAKAARLRKAVHHPDQGKKALNAEATHVSDQCCRKALGLAPRWRP